ncbi:MAG: nitrous oxide reductase accessory protein NosL [Burkholderiales bacterium]|nr:nitrous oxide reductase accessory protein NosL [Burkholderiales bacterium]
MSITRRRFLFVALAAAVSACGQSAAPVIMPLEIDPHTTCDLDGMLLADYPGPKAQIFYVGQSAPTFFCDTVEMFHTLLAPEQIKAVQAVYVQDMGAADWEQPRGHWIDARTAYYVLGSKRHGSMGTTVASFAQEESARKFAAQWGGRLLRYAEVRPDMVDLSGGALHDSRM